MFGQCARMSIRSCGNKFWTASLRRIWPDGCLHSRMLVYLAGLCGLSAPSRIVQLGPNHQKQTNMLKKACKVGFVGVLLAIVPADKSVAWADEPKVADSKTS